jgi:hypothetical protein
MHAYTHVYADTSLLQNGETPLAVAKLCGQGAVVALLRQHGGT